uniref:MFS transporter n=1 Tax=Elaeophora elaphi TaxID=1147741 RepID=A0A0R3RRT7_9BILA
MTSDPLVSVVELADQYKSEFENGLSELMKHATTFVNSTNKIRTYEQFNVLHRELLKQRDEMMKEIQDTQSTLPDLDTTKLMRAFSWVAIMLLGLSFGAFLGSRYVQFELKQIPSVGLLTGYIFADKDLVGMPPIAALTPMAIGLIPHFGSSAIGKDHAKLICLTIGGGFFLHLCLGAITDLSLPYLLLAGFYAFIGFVVLQFYVNNAGKDPVSLDIISLIRSSSQMQKSSGLNAIIYCGLRMIHIDLLIPACRVTYMYQLWFVWAVIFSQALVYVMFGLDVKELTEAAPRSSSLFL